MTRHPADDEEAFPTLGDLIRRQRQLASLTLRQLSGMVGISNPYLSQIEHGLRDPSEQVLRSLADSLEISVEVLRAAGGSRRDGAGVVEAISTDPDLTASQRRALLETYAAFRQATIASRSFSRGASDADASAGEEPS